MSSIHNSAIAYRPEIDGLRAIAVLPVILFHAGFELFSGGFIGVDVFFVISGYLITSIILKEIEQGNFSISRFYERRARRILPALFFVIACCLPFAWIWLLPDNLIQFGHSLISVATFSSNIYFWKTTDYFAPDAEEQPLLHTWSLAVEEQFYLLFPLLLMLGWRFGKVKIFWLTSMVALLSIGLAEWGWRNSSVANFYLLPTRAWELLAGSLLAFTPVSKAKEFREGGIARVGSLLGIGLVIYPVFTFDGSMPFPSLFTLVPIAGTVLIIGCSSENNLAGKMLSSRILVATGLISYSAYLWHQPLFAFSKILYLGSSPTNVTCVLAIATLMLAWFTTKYIETPFRLKSAYLSKSSSTKIMAVFGLIFTVMLGMCIHIFQGFPERLPKQFIERDWPALTDANHGLNIACEYTEKFSVKADCVYGENPKVLLWGDSYAMHLAQGLIASDISFVQATRSTCGPSFFDAPHPDHGGYNVAWSEKCFEFNQSVLAYMKENKKLRAVVLASPFEQYHSGEFFNPERGTYTPTLDERVETFTKTISVLKSMGLQPVVVSPPPRSGYNIGGCLERVDSGLLALGDAAANGCDFSWESRTTESKYIEAFIKQIVDKTTVTALDLGKLICDEEICKTEQDDVPIYSDGGHLSKAGSAHLALKHDIFKVFR